MYDQPTKDTSAGTGQDGDKVTEHSGAHDERSDLASATVMKATRARGGVAGESVPQRKATTPAQAAEPTNKTTPNKTPVKKAAASKPDARKATAGTRKTEQDIPVHVAKVPAARTPAEAAPPAAASEPTSGAPTALWDRVRTDPGHAPELLALAAVATIGPRARDWARELRATYPAATADGLARLATRRYVRLSAPLRLTAVAAGLLAPAAQLAALGWLRAELVLRVAAAYGQDPADPARAEDLLVLTRVHETAETARTALQAATRQTADNLDEALTRAADAAWRLATPLVPLAGVWSLRHLAGRVAPGAGLLLTLVASRTATERLAQRAVAHYRRVTAS